MTEVQRGRGRRKEDAKGRLLSQRLSREGKEGNGSGFDGGCGLLKGVHLSMSVSREKSNQCRKEW